MMEEFASSSWFTKKVSLLERRSIQLPVLWNLKQAVHGLAGESLYVFENDLLNCMTEATCITQVAVDDLGHEVLAFSRVFFPRCSNFNTSQYFTLTASFFLFNLYVHFKAV